MLKKTLFIAIIALRSGLYSSAQLPVKEELFNTAHNQFEVVDHQEGPFIIVVIPNKIKYLSRDGRVLMRNFADYNKIADSLTEANIRGTSEPRPNYKVVQNLDSAKALVFVQGITRTNSDLYEYRILDQKNANSRWQKFDTFYPATYSGGWGAADPEMAVIGGVTAPWDHYITVDIRRKGIDSILSSASIVWANHPPKVIATYAPNEFNRFLSLFKIRSQVETELMIAPSSEDSLLMTRKVFASTENSLIFYLDDIIKQKVVEYKLEGESSKTDWKLNNLDFNFIWLKDLSPGKYRLLLRFSTQRHNITIYDFEIKPAWQQTTWFKLTAGSLVAAFFGFVLMTIRSNHQKREIEQKNFQNEKTEVELLAVRSQLNPHFIFNSLNSIQGLITKNDFSSANKYLLIFSRLMRETLHNSDRKFNSIEMEIQFLHTYLSLEQLRFGFEYEITVQPEIDTATTEIPSLLLQTLVENAVKHGMEMLKERGIIRIEIAKQGSDLTATVVNNGIKFNNQAPTDGYGLKLTRKRIELLNRTFHIQTVSLEIKGDEKETIVTLNLKNWLA